MNKIICMSLARSDNPEVLAPYKFEGGLLNPTSATEAALTCATLHNRIK